MSKNQDKTICCRVDSDFFELLDAITKNKGVKLSAFMRELLNNAVTAELRRLDILSTKQIVKALSADNHQLDNTIQKMQIERSETND